MVFVETALIQYLVVVLVIVNVKPASTELESNSCAVLGVTAHVKSADSHGTIQLAVVPSVAVNVV